MLFFIIVLYTSTNIVQQMIENLHARVQVGWKIWKKYTSGPRYWNVPVLVNTGTFLVYQYCLKMWYLCSLEHAGIIQKLTILECENGLVLSNTHVPVSGTSSILFPKILLALRKKYMRLCKCACVKSSTARLTQFILTYKKSLPIQCFLPHDRKKIHHKTTQYKTNPIVH